VGLAAANIPYMTSPLYAARLSPTEWPSSCSSVAARTFGVLPLSRSASMTAYPLMICMLEVAELAADQPPSPI